ncbi:hypothetical protein MKK84_27920 [Methylobacterium sp. E-065]|uniref:hypothetical protein n=1 Tax=Methylobacterium sp. E-065 TaxID=2836583 RepID=UPI001FBB909D|nr:hypothetical protein [Methylobacterium sp. E-065]MCJ2021199.1 hypothetical protein [Methylobacterium sp. E-065]
MIGIGLTDLDELILTCKTERARDYIQEALLSYRSGAYRAAIVVTWIAVVFDLVDKIRELSLSGDPQAKAVIEDFDNTLEQLAEGNQSTLPKALQFEREILDTARNKFQLLDYYQYVDLRRLFEDRNRCAHPTFEISGGIFRPSAETARVHIRNAVVHVLQQPPVQGKAAIEAVLSKVRSRYFPTTVEDVKEALKQEIERARPALVNGLVDRLIWDGFKPHNLVASRADVTALRAVLDLHRSVAEPRVRSQVSKAMRIADESNLSNACSLVAALPEAWDGLDSPQRKQFLNYMDGGRPIVTALFIKDAVNNAAIREPALQRISRMDFKALGQLINEGVGAEAFDRVIELIAISSDEDVNSALSLPILILVKHLTSDNISAVIRSVADRSARLRYAAGINNFVTAVRSQHKMPDEELDKLLIDNGFDSLFPSAADN